MFIVTVQGVIKGMESGAEMRFDLQRQVLNCLDNEFGDFGVWEVFVKEQLIPDERLPVWNDTEGEWR